ncbi:8-amino-7-oxononanoate synthase [Olivibacter sp. SDN3]|uniref:aminotransferase class I/II-fold pyridoxal phosphate-dependent enzyme n=1 Tax=Olivibacter sp. SDN3 TaxID=2764720 RepID=UPI001650E071|nr:8-amino-7-oxononanoate synthase [Olivibacter sp. SDN3]QNL48547.1 8-amino-7-oxononanoate synthase [Olivibacter sp. SDN3]
MISALSKREKAGELRELSTTKGLVDFCSNDYFGWASSEAFGVYVNALLKESNLSMGATGSRLLSGNSHFIEALEHEIASFHMAESALFLCSGYMANVGLMTALGQRNCYILRDEYVHASVVDGCRLSLARSYHFKHNDLDDLASKLIKVDAPRYVVVESLYSMDGDFAPIRDLIVLCKQYDAFLIVDEAHALGVFGGGLVQTLGLQHDVFARVVTFGKALGSQGAAIVGSHVLKQYLINFCRPFIYSTAPALFQLITVKVGYHFLRNEQQKQDELQDKCRFFMLEMSNRLPKPMQRLSPIQTYIVPENDAVKAASLALQYAGFDVRAIRSPTVKKGQERLRICLHTFNKATEIRALCKVLKDL